MKDNSFSLALTSDVYRLRKLKSVWISLIIMFVLTFLSFAAYWIGIRIVNATPPEQAPEIGATVHFLNAFATSMLFGASSTANVELFIAIVACIFIGKDFSCGYIALTTARGTKRVNTYFSKWLSLVCLLIVYMCFALLLSGIFFAISGSPGGFTGANFATLMRNFALQLLAGIASVSIFVMINFLCRSTGTSIATSIALYLLLNIIVSVITTILSIDNSDGNNLDWTIFLPMQQTSIATSADKLSTAEVVAATVMPIVYTAIATLIGYFTFEKRDIK